ncbi:MAG: putative sulfate/molybdate transporter [Candidatus Rokuibacteriota bacterium]
MRIAGNRYDLRELNGAFGDLGTLIPFVLGYVTVNRLDPAGVFTTFGVLMVAAGLWFRTPMPVQPMKAIAAVAVSQPGLVTPGAIWAGGLFTGALWLALGLTGVATRVARLTGRPVVYGLVLGLGLTLMLEGVKMMARDPVVAVAAAVLTFALLMRPRLPATLILMAAGVAVAVFREPALLADLAEATLRWRLPSPPASLAWTDVLTGAVVLALPQAALTFGNAIVATVEENNALFPDRPVTVRAMALGHGVMNLVGAAVGGVPVCHGAGGMAGHVRFGARTGGALVMLGLLLLAVGLFLADSVGSLLRLFPLSVLGVVLFVGGLELAVGALPAGGTRGERTVALLTAAVAMWNMGVAFLAGLVMWHAQRYGWMKVEETDEAERT